MKSSRGDKCFKAVDHFVILFRLITATCVSCEQCFLIDVRFDVQLCTLSIVVVFIVLAFALNKILKSYTLEIFMLCNTFML